MLAVEPRERAGWLLSLETTVVERRLACSAACCWLRDRLEPR